MDPKRVQSEFKAGSGGWLNYSIELLIQSNAPMILVAFIGRYRVGGLVAGSSGFQAG